MATLKTLTIILNAMVVFFQRGYTTRMPIIPLPYQIEARSGEFQVTAETVILADPPNPWNAGYFQDMR